MYMYSLLVVCHLPLLLLNQTHLHSLLFLLLLQHSFGAVPHKSSINCHSGWNFLGLGQFAALHSWHHAKLSRNVLNCILLMMAWLLLTNMSWIGIFSYLILCLNIAITKLKQITCSKILNHSCLHSIYSGLILYMSRTMTWALKTFTMLVISTPKFIVIVQLSGGTK